MPYQRLDIDTWKVSSHDRYLWVFFIRFNACWESFCPAMGGCLKNMYASLLILVYQWKRSHKPYLEKIRKYGENISYQSFAPFQYQVTLYYDLKVFRQNERFYSPYWKISGRETVFITISWFFFLLQNLIKSRRFLDRSLNGLWYSGDS